MYPVADLYAAIRDNDNEPTGESDVTGKGIGCAGEVLTTAGTLALRLGVLAAETVWKSAPKVLRATSSTLCTVADSIEKCERGGAD